MTDDLINRRMAIAAADRADYTGLAVEDVKKVTDEVVKEIKKLPSAQSEIIRCKDCKYYMGNWYCEAWNNSPGFPAVDGNMFCSMGERKES